MYSIWRGAFKSNELLHSSIKHKYADSALQLKGVGMLMPPKSIFEVPSSSDEER